MAYIDIADRGIAVLGLVVEILYNYMYSKSLKKSKLEAATTLELL